MTNSFWIMLVLQLAGVVVVIAEVFLPSGGVLAVVAAALFGYSIYGTYTQISSVAGIAMAVADLITVPILVIVGLKLIAKSPATLSRTLSRGEGVVAQDAAAGELLGREGTALSDLRPAGTATIGGRRVDVVSRGEYLRKGATLVVEEVAGNRIVVREK
ncbi:MAG TPA: NfeD family protein [Deferrisomatales bacterium]|nr:NfeD family protein [Deferrisomatales bacterium]